LLSGSVCITNTTREDVSAVRFIVHVCSAMHNIRRCKISPSTDLVRI
jgi:hypothetical protein